MRWVGGGTISVSPLLDQSLRGFDLQEVEFDRSRSAKHVDSHTYACALGFHCLDRAGKVTEWPFHYLDPLANGKEGLRPGSRHPDFDLPEDLLDLPCRDRRRRAIGFTDKAHHLWNRVYQVPGFFIERHLYQEVAGKEPPLAQGEL